jgi:IS30 family transposase
MTRNSIWCKLPRGTAEAVSAAFVRLREEYGSRFSQVFKTITGDNGSEFAELVNQEIGGTQVYFTHPYSSFEKGTNERHNGLLRRFIPKGRRIDDYSDDDISFIADWSNGQPRKILNYRTPEEMFEAELDRIYAS